MRQGHPLEAFLGAVLERREFSALFDHGMGIGRLLTDAALPFPLRPMAKASLFVAFGLIAFGQTRQLQREARRFVASARKPPPFDLGEFEAAMRRPERPKRAQGAPRTKARAKARNGAAHGAPPPSAAA